MRKPNILVVMTDHQRGDTVSPGSPVHIPNVKRLGAGGVTFTNASIAAGYLYHRFDRGDAIFDL